MKKAIQPSHMIVVGVCAMLSAGFFAVAHVGSAKREIRGMEYGFGSRKAPEPPPAPGLVASFKRGAEAIVDKAGGAVDDVFSWGDSKPAGTETASAGGAGAQGEGADDKDPFEDFYNRNYGKGNSAGSSSYGGSAGGGSFGGGSFGGGSWGGSSGSSGGGSSAGGDDGLPAAGAGAKPEAAKSAGGGDEAEAGRAPRASRPVVENEDGEWVRKRFKRGAAGEKLASLPGGRPFDPLERAGDLSGGGLSGAGGSASGKGGGKLEGLSGPKGKVELNGADEKASSGAKSNYESKMSGGASAAAAAGAAAAGGGGVPAASGPKEVGADEKDKKGKDEKGKDEKAKDGKSSSDTDGPSIWTLFKKKPGANRPATGPVTASAKRTAAEEEPGFLKEVAAERQRGAVQLPEGEAELQPDEAHLKSGALIKPSKEKAANFAENAGKEEKVEEKPDPENFSKLSDARRKELRTALLVFLKSVENKHGAMSQILFTPCSKEKETCSANGLTLGFITMHTEDARVQVSLKYADKRWTPYTVSFASTVSLKELAPKAQPQTEPSEENGEEGEAQEQPAEAP